MGLTATPAVEIEEMINASVLSVPDFVPSDLFELLENDREIFVGQTRGERFAQFAERTIYFGYRRNLKTFCYLHSFWMTFFEFQSMLRHSDSTGGPLFIPSAYEGSISNVSGGEGSAEDDVRIYRLFLSETGRLPNVNSVEDVLRLREDKRIRSLRQVISEWRVTEVGEGHPQAVANMRRDIELATRDLHRLDGAQRIGRFIGFLAIPVAIADAINGSFLGLTLAPVSPAIDIARKWRLRRMGWMGFGGGR